MSHIISPCGYRWLLLLMLPSVGGWSVLGYRHLVILKMKNFKIYIENILLLRLRTVLCLEMFRYQS